MFSATCHAMMNQFFITSMPFFVAKLGGLTLYAGLFITVYSISALVTRPVSGFLSDKYSRVKQLIFGALICSVCCCFFGIFAVIPLLLVVRTFMGIGFGMHSTCAGAAVADVLPKSRLSEGIGYFTIYATIAYAIGPGIALQIIDRDRLSDFSLLFWISAVMCGICFLTNCLISYERKRKKAGRIAEEVPEVIEEKTPAKQDDSLEEPLPKAFFGFEYAIFAPLLVVILMQIGLAGLMAYIAPFARWKGLGSPSLYFTVTAAGTFISRLTIGRVADKRGSDIIVIPAVIVLIASIVSISNAGSMAMLVAMGFPVGLAQGALFPTLNAMLFKRCSTARRGTASGAYFSAMDIALAVGTPFLGALADARDYGFMYLVAASFVTLSLILYILIASDRVYERRRLKSG